MPFITSLSASKLDGAGMQMECLSVVCNSDSECVRVSEWEEVEGG